MHPCSFFFARRSSRATSRRSRNARIGLVAICSAVVGSGDARGQGSVESDREVLDALYHATGGPDWRNSANWLSDAPLSEWHGVATSFRSGRVNALSLTDNQLVGSIPPELGQLSLEVLSLAQNRLSGPIPSELGQLTRLEALYLADNRLSGPIPSELGQLTRLEILQIQENRLDGPIPSELGQLTRLEVLTLAENRLSGPIPSELGQLTRLNLLSIDDDTGLCLPPRIQDTAFGRLAIENDVPLCNTVPALPGAALWILAVALVMVGLRRTAASASIRVR